MVDSFLSRPGNGCRTPEPLCPIINLRPALKSSKNLISLFFQRQKHCGRHAGRKAPPQPGLSKSTFAKWKICAHRSAGLSLQPQRLPLSVNRGIYGRRGAFSRADCALRPGRRQSGAAFSSPPRQASITLPTAPTLQSGRPRRPGPHAQTSCAAICHQQGAGRSAV